MNYIAACKAYSKKHKKPYKMYKKGTKEHTEIKKMMDKSSKKGTGVVGGRIVGGKLKKKPVKKSPVKKRNLKKVKGGAQSEGYELPTDELEDNDVVWVYPGYCGTFGGVKPDFDPYEEMDPGDPKLQVFWKDCVKSGDTNLPELAYPGSSGDAALSRWRLVGGNLKKKKCCNKKGCKNKCKKRNQKKVRGGAVDASKYPQEELFHRPPLNNHIISVKGVPDNKNYYIEDTNKDHNKGNRNQFTTAQILDKEHLTKDLTDHYYQEPAIIKDEPKYNDNNKVEKDNNPPVYPTSVENIKQYGQRIKTGYRTNIYSSVPYSSVIAGIPQHRHSKFNQINFTGGKINKYNYNPTKKFNGDII